MSTTPDPTVLPPVAEQAVNVPPHAQPGLLVLPPQPRGVVLIAHGSGSDHQSPRQRHMAQVLAQAGLASLRADMLTTLEALDRRNVFDIPLLATRLVEAAQWLQRQPGLENLSLGCLGASTGAAAALLAAHTHPAIRAVVSRGGRPDLAGAALGALDIPVLLIVGELDTEVLPLNEQARQRLGDQCELLIIPGATHLFEEPGTLEAAARAAAKWFALKL
ncbi:dienelactone hydrolase family protein [Azohydromonas caseinilytica]|uniref:Alpha/beta hydrolase n=1 Tax=Azohydromonas caseinilytica TaxID=2728836 RepID=A0A848F0C9_9BURK|nr:alpha/beta family hydrolase [Azohydromonas caseinilytica]NML13517.1 alpha/beta hydrolase [Azohydromonas caseinilytica]